MNCLNSVRRPTEALPMHHHQENRRVAMKLNAKRLLTVRGYGRKYGHMKTTIEIDDAKLLRVMSLTGLKTRKEAVDWALTEAERIARVDQIASHPWDSATVKESVEPGYDVLSIRNQSVNYRGDS